MKWGIFHREACSLQFKMWVWGILDGEVHPLELTLCRYAKSENNHLLFVRILFSPDHVQNGVIPSQTALAQWQSQTYDLGGRGSK